MHYKIEMYLLNYLNYQLKTQHKLHFKVKIMEYQIIYIYIYIFFFFFSVGEGEGGMFQENSIETGILSRVKQITSPGWMHETSART